MSRILSGRWGSIVLVVAVIATGVVLAAWKHSALQNADAAAANQPEPVEAVGDGLLRRDDLVGHGTDQE